MSKEGESYIQTGHPLKVRVLAALNVLRYQHYPKPDNVQTVIKTTQVVSVLTGKEYVADKGISVGVSFNAEVGRILLNNRNEFGIRQLDGDIRIKDARGSITQTCSWLLYENVPLECKTA